MAGKEAAIVLQAYMHCEGCATEVSNCLKGFDGVEQVTTDIAGNKVTVKGKDADPLKVLKRVQKKYSRNAALISPKPKPQSQTQKKEPEKKEDQPQVKTAMLKMLMHCEGCSRDIKENIERMPGVLTARPDMAKSVVVVRGAIDPPKLVETISRRMRKHVELVKEEKEKSRDDGKSNRNEDEGNVVSYPPQYPLSHLCPCDQIFSDENVHSCSVM